MTGKPDNRKTRPLEPDEEWREKAACLTANPEWFFPTPGELDREAKQVCYSCSVRNQCLDYAITHHEHHGVWGGLSEKQRTRLANRMGRTA